MLHAVTSSSPSSRASTPSTSVRAPSGSRPRLRTHGRTLARTQTRTPTHRHTDTRTKATGSIQGARASGDPRQPAAQLCRSIFVPSPSSRESDDVERAAAALSLRAPHTVAASRDPCRPDRVRVTPGGEKRRKKKPEIRRRKIDLRGSRVRSSEVRAPGPSCRNTAAAASPGRSESPGFSSRPPE